MSETLINQQRKSDLRTRRRSQLEVLNLSSSRFLQEALHHRLDNLLHFLLPNQSRDSQHKGIILGGFQPIQQEPCVNYAKFNYLQWAFPRVQNGGMEYVLGGNLERGSFGIKQPIHGETVSMSDLQAILVPGLAFNRQGWRLGRGMGFFDRYLKQFSGYKIGICYQCQIGEDIPVDDWDVPMDFVVTDQAVYGGDLWK